jgi:hypothetical protein
VQRFFEQEKRGQMDFFGLVILFIGAILLVVTFIDIFQTVIQIGGGGIVSKLFSAYLWKFLVMLARGNPQSKILDYAGSLILVSLFFFWVMLLWAGFGLIYLSDGDAVVDTYSGHSASAIGKLYFVGYTLTSLGNGDLKAGSDDWRLMTNFMGIGSVFIVTLSISYLLPVLQAVLSKRVLAKYINQLGNSPQEILLNGWNGKNFSQLYDKLSAVDTMILKHTEDHMAYPILHYFHAKKQEFSAPLNLTKLDEALTLIQILELDTGSNQYDWLFLRKSLDGYIKMLKNSFVRPNQVPPPLEFERLAATFPHVVHKTNYLERMQEELSERRKVLLGLINKDCWQWDDVEQAVSN